MRWLVMAMLLPGCVAEEDGTQEAMDLALESAVELPESDEIEPDIEYTARDGIQEQTRKTLDCGGGGTVNVTIQRTMEDEPYLKKGYIQWRYEGCEEWPYGTIDGTASYSKEVKKGPKWSRSLRYFADLTHSGAAGGKCNAYVTLSQEWEDSDHELGLPVTCPHPVTEWWERLGL